MRVHRSFAFVDVSGFTAMTEMEGDERAVDVLTAFRSLLRDICSRRGVRIAKWLGDGVMLVCVDTRPLLETILELHYVVREVGAIETVSIRSGVTRGDVILMEGDDYIGHCVQRRGAPVRPGFRRRGTGCSGGDGAPAELGSDRVGDPGQPPGRGEAGTRVEHLHGRAAAPTGPRTPSAGCP